MRYLCLLVTIFVLSACSHGAVLLPSVEQVEQEAPQPEATTGPDVVTVSIGPTPTFAQPSTTTPPTGRAFENGQAVIARVNNEPILLDVYNKKISALEQTLVAQGVTLQDESSRQRLADASTNVLAGLINQHIITQQAEKMNLAVSEEEIATKRREIEAQIGDNAQLERWLANNQIDNQTFAADLQFQLTASRVYEYVTQHVPETAPQIRLQYIRTDDQATANAMRQQLEAGTKFARLVQQESEKTDTVTTAALDWFPKSANQIPVPVADVAFSLQPNEIGGPIATETGYYLIKLEEKETNRPLTEEIRQSLKRRIFIDWLQKHRAASVVENFADVH